MVAGLSALYHGDPGRMRSLLSGRFERIAEIQRFIASSEMID